jgi:hypothetical protein
LWGRRFVLLLFSTPIGGAEKRQQLSSCCIERIDREAELVALADAAPSKALVERAVGLATDDVRDTRAGEEVAFIARICSSAGPAGEGKAGSERG